MPSEFMGVPGVVVAGTQTGVGKTSVTLGLLRALVREGQSVRPFKVGPDFIDPGHHRAAAGQWSHNLDGWMLDGPVNRELYRRHTHQSDDGDEIDVAVVEGVMGMFDGVGGGDDTASTAHIARQLGLPIILVVDVWNMSRSVAAMVHGYETFDPKLDVGGILLNRVGSPGHADMVREAVESSCQAPVLGTLPRREALHIPERHLGLWLADDPSLESEYLDRLADWVERHVDIQKLLGVASQGSRSEDLWSDEEPRGSSAPETRARIGVAYDRAFCFYYRDNLQRLEDAGAELVYFSPLSDAFPEDLDGLYLGGGYPELHAGALESRRYMRRSIRDFCASGKPVYAECGGLMYLGAKLRGEDGVPHDMCGVFPYEIRMGELSLGYGEVTFSEANPFWQPGTSARGHVFHASEVVPGTDDELEHVYRVRSPDGQIHREGYRRDSVLASYLHLHFGSHPELAERFVRRASSE
jgi:cobyrinic acid a,c-diamide synthase